MQCCCCCEVASVISDSRQPHRQQPIRLPRSWDSSGKDTGMGCHFLLQCMKVKSESEVAQSRLTPSDSMDCSLPGSSIHGIFQARVLEWVVIAFSVMSAVVNFKPEMLIREILLQLHWWIYWKMVKKILVPLYLHFKHT